MSSSTIHRHRPPIEEATNLAPVSTRERRRRGRRFRQRRILTGLLATLLVFAVWLSFSLGGALMNPALGSSIGARAAEWARAHGGSGIVNWIENEWYSHHPPPVGGTPPRGAISQPGVVTTPTSTVPHLALPAPIIPFAHPAIPGEGQWRPVGRLVHGIPAVYVTTLRPDAAHTSYVAGVAWMDTKLLRTTLYSGSWIPGGGPYPNSAPVKPAAATSLVAAFNAGFLMSNANGGYYTAGHTEIPLRKGGASFVVDRNGSATVGAWGSDVSMNSQVVSVRQNLSLLVAGGHLVAGLNANDTTKWGYTLGNAVYVWRSGVGVTASGALVYVGGPGLNITDLAHLLLRAGAVRAMEMDINTDWVNYSYYTPTTVAGRAGAHNGRELLPGMSGTPGRYFAPWWARDFITVSAR